MLLFTGDATATFGAEAEAEAEVEVEVKVEVGALSRRCQWCCYCC